MKKILIISALCVCVVAGAGYGIFYAIYDAGGAAKKTVMAENHGKVTAEQMAEYEQEGKNPFGEKISYETITDEDYQDYLHGMAHQKVIAEEKWSFYQMNDARISWLLDGLSQAELKHESTYEDILTKWEKGDFQTADRDHNRIWKLQGGTIGKATGVYSPEQEQEFLSKH